MKFAPWLSNEAEDMTSIRENLLEWGVSDGILLDGKPYRSDGPPFTAEELRADIMNLYNSKDKL